MRHSILTINIVVVVDELGDSEIKNAVGAGEQAMAGGEHVMDTAQSSGHARCAWC